MNVNHRSDVEARVDDYRSDIDDRKDDLTVELGEDSTRC